MKPIATLALFIAPVALIVWFFLREPIPASHSSGLEINPTEASNPASPESSTLRAPNDKSSEAQRTAASNLPKAPSPPTQATLAESDSQWIEGQVIFPDGTPVDERCTLVAVAPSPSGAFRDTPPQRAPIQTNGTFRIAVLIDAVEANFRIEGRYCFLRNPYNWKKSENLPPILHPQLGSMIELVLDLSALSITKDPEVLAGLYTSFPMYTVMEGGLEGRFGNYTGRVQVEELSVFFFAIPVQAGGQSASKAYFSTRGGAREDITLPKQVAGEFLRIHHTVVPEARLLIKVVDEKGQSVLDGKLRLTCGGQPIKQWSLHWTRYENVTMAATSLKVKDGQLQVNRLPAGDCQLSFASPGYLNEEPLTFETVAGQESEIELVVSRGLAIQGQVQWSTGEPASGAKVALLGYPRFGVGSNVPEVVSCDGEGRFRMSGFKEELPVDLLLTGVLPGESDARNAVKMRTRTTHVADVQPSQGTQVFVLDSAPQGIAGVVVDDVGKPVTSFRIWWTSKLPAPGGIQKAASPKVSIQSEEGRFELTGMPPARGVLNVRASRHLDFAQSFDYFPTGTEVRLVLTRVARISGKVFDAAGESIEAKVFAQRVDPANDYTHVRGSRKEDARASTRMGYRLRDLPPATYEVWAWGKARGESGREIVDLKPGGHVKGLDFALASAGRLEGRVVSDWLAKGLTVEASREGVHGKLYSAAVTEAGTFSLDSLPAGEYQIGLQRYLTKSPRATRNNFERSIKDVVVHSGRTTRVVLGGGAGDGVMVRGKLLKGSEVVPGARLEFRLPFGEASNSMDQTDLDGEYLVHLPGPGEYHVSVSYHATWTVKVGSEPNQRIDLRVPENRLLVTVVDGIGQPLEVGHLPVVLWWQGDPSSRAPDYDYTDQGTQYRNLAAGRYRVRRDEMRLNGKYYAINEPEWVEVVDSSELQTFKVKLAETAVLEGAVAQAQWGARVRAFYGPTGKEGFVTAVVRKGNYRFDHLPAGEWWVGLSDAPASALKRLVVEPGGNKHLDL